MLVLAQWCHWYCKQKVHCSGWFLVLHASQPTDHNSTYQEIKTQNFSTHLFRFKLFEEHREQWDIFLICFSFIETRSSNSKSESAHQSDVITVSGIISPLLVSRIQHGQPDYTRCAERDYSRSIQEIIRLGSKASARTPQVLSNQMIGNNIESMEKRFIFNIRQDLHNLGCAYRQIIGIVELLYLNMLRCVHSWWK